ncbi:MAG TPA: hypothetical protein VLT33_21275 [Labilithrix sp.]|nr:hypothetical protein [Labilithrix sp.]
MTRTYLKLGLLPFFLLLAVGSSSPKKDDGDKKANDLAAKLAAAASASTTTTSAALTGKVLGNCTQKNGGSCREIYNFRLGGEASEKSGCETIGGSYTGGGAACVAKDNMIGVCTTNSPLDPAAVREKLYYYNEGTNKGVTGAVAKDGCAALTGTWVDGPAANASAKPAAKTTKKK